MSKIHRLFVFSLAFYLLFNLIIPNQTVLANNENPVIPKSENVIIESEPVVIKVVSSSSAISPQVIPISFAEQGSKFCNNTVIQAGSNLIQQAHLINYNQPASCFSLQISKATVVQTSLAVAPLKSYTQSIKVVVIPAKLDVPSLTSVPVSQTTPILPMLAFTPVLSLFFVKRDAKSSKVLAFRNNFVNLISLEQLQVFRC